MNAIALTRADIERTRRAGARAQRVRVGAMVAATHDTAHGVPLPGARWSPPRRVVEVFARRDDIHGRAFVCFYTEFGEDARISDGAKEGDCRIRIPACAGTEDAT